MELIQESCEEFVSRLASKAPTPGGGGAAALVGAIGVALGNMVGSLTVGKKKYAAVEEEVFALKAQADILQAELLALVAEDAVAFAPLAQAYGLPRETAEQQAEKARVMEAALRTACAPPLKMMEKCAAAIALHQQFLVKGTALAVSDIGVGVELCRAALRGASLNVLINTKAMQDRVYAEELNRQVEHLLQQAGQQAEAIYAEVVLKIC